MSLSGADVCVVGVGSPDNAGSGVATAGDADGDGLDDFLVGASGHGTGEVYLMSGALTGSHNTADATATFLGDPVDDCELGEAIASAGDLDGDGYANLLLGDENSSLDAYFGGMTYLAMGPFAGMIDLVADSTAISGGVRTGSFGVSVAMGDIDGDAGLDILVGAPGVFGSALDSGAVFVFLGP